MAQQLVDLGEPVSDRTLTLNLIRGLNERFRDAGRHIRRDNPFLKFKDAVDELILEELTMAHQPPARPTALLAAGKGAPSGAPPPSSSGARPHTPPQQPSHNGGSNSGGEHPGASPRIAADGAASLAPARHRRPPATGSPGAASRPPRPAQAVLVAPAGRPSSTRGPGPSSCGLARDPRHRSPQPRRRHSSIKRCWSSSPGASLAGPADASTQVAQA